jgi:hypothetical protein
MARNHALYRHNAFGGDGQVNKTTWTVALMAELPELNGFNSIRGLCMMLALGLVLKSKV